MKKSPGDRGQRGQRGAGGARGSGGGRGPRDNQGPRDNRGSRSERGPRARGSRPDREVREARADGGARGERKPPDERGARDDRKVRDRANRKPRRPWEAQPKRAATPRPSRAEGRPSRSEARPRAPEPRPSGDQRPRAPEPKAPPTARREPPRERRSPPPATARAPRPGRRYDDPSTRPAPRDARPESTEARQKVATYRLLIEYEGTRYSGWQEQKNAPTVMGALRRAIEEAGLPIVEMGGAGRTDAGVHALAQCAHLRLGQRFDTTDLCRALNKRLPRDVHVLGAEPAEVAFHARHDAVARAYLYQISRRRTALAKPWVWWVRDRLDVERLRATAALCVGRHDFRNFADVDPRSKDSTLVEVERVEVVEEGALILVRIVASHFLWRMVRRLIGTLVQVAAGNLSSDVFAKLLTGAAPGPDDPRPAEWTAPPSGLFLERVVYPGDPPLDPPVAVVRVAAE